MRYIVVALGVLGLIGVLAGVKFSQIKNLIEFGEAMAKAGPPPEAVGTALAKADSWENRLSSVGTINPARGVSVANDAAGVVSAIRFESGQQVKRGQILVEVNSDVERAQLKSAQARLDLARISAERSRRLLKENAVAQSQVDNDEATLRSAAADVSALQEQIERKVVRAPFDGRLGIRLVNLGQYLSQGTAVTVLQSTEANYVDFTLPQQQVERLTVGMPVRVNEGMLAGPRAEGTIAAIEPQLDAVARAGKIRALLGKIEGNVSPGMFVNVSVILSDKRPVVIVPATALVHAAYGDSVFIVEDKKDEKGTVVKGPDGRPAKAARQQFVKTGEARGDFVAILEGVKAGQEVVSAGAFKLRNGAPVVVNNSVKVEPKLAPTPENR